MKRLDVAGKEKRRKGKETAIISIVWVVCLLLLERELTLQKLSGETRKAVLVWCVDARVDAMEIEC